MSRLRLKRGLGIGLGLGSLALDPEDVPVPSLPPKGADRGPHSFFPAKLVGEGHSPVVAVLLREVKYADDPIVAPKGADHGPKPLFPCKMTAFEGSTMGAMMPFADPSRRHALSGSATELAAAVLVREGHAPVGAVLLAGEAKAPRWR